MRRKPLALAVLLLVNGCQLPQKHPQTLPSSSTTGTPPLHPELTVEAATREVNPDPEAIQRALDATLGLQTIVLGQQAIRTIGRPFMDFVVLKAKGEDYCHKYVPSSQQSECSADEQGVPWSAQEVLGFAVLSFNDPKTPAVTASRFVGRGLSIFSTHPEHEPVGQPDTSVLSYTMQSNTNLTSLTGADVDGDGAEEFVVLVSGDRIDTNDDGEGVFEELSRVRLLVMRADLTIEADIDVHQQVNTRSPRPIPDEFDRIKENYSFVPPSASSPGQLVLTWCEIDSQIVSENGEACVFDTLCADPTQRVIIAYDPKSDSYPKPVVEQLRPPVTENDCP